MDGVVNFNNSAREYCLPQSVNKLAYSSQYLQQDRQRGWGWEGVCVHPHPHIATKWTVHTHLSACSSIASLRNRKGLETG
jgi:hypothetical protein